MLPTPNNGTYNSNGTNIVNDKATLDCDSGYVLSTAEESDISIECQANGVWSSVAATCIRSKLTLVIYIYGYFTYPFYSYFDPSKKELKQIRMSF